MCQAFRESASYPGGHLGRPYGGGGDLGGCRGRCPHRPVLRQRPLVAGAVVAEGRFYRCTPSLPSRGGLGGCVRRRPSGIAARRTRDARPYGGIAAPLRSAKALRQWGHAGGKVDWCVSASAFAWARRSTAFVGCEQVVVGDAQGVADGPELGGLDMLGAPLDFDEALPRHADALQL